jgi:DNA-binding transcriptional LysR family regulator
MDRLDAMTVFLAAADGGSLSAAGRRLGMPLATASRKLAELEAHLGIRLMTRTTRRLALTEAGRDYLIACREILGHVEEAERRAAGGHASPRGELIVAAPLVFGRLHVVPVVAEYLAEHDDVDVRLTLSDRNADLYGEHVDVAVRIGNLPDSGLTAVRVGTITRVACASKRYLKRFGIPAAPADLRAHRCVTFEGLASSSAWSFPGPDGPIRIPVRSRLAVNTADAAIAAAEAGVGITRLLSYQVSDSLRAGRLTRILDAHEPPSVPVSLLYVRQGSLPLKTRRFLELAAPRLQAALAAIPSGPGE